jgi:uracil-DNA glycosylase family 4
MRSHAQISLIQPKLICTLGNPSLKTLVDKNLTIGKVHGTVLEKNGLRFFPIYHPAASLHNPGLRESLVDDFKKLMEYLRK